MKNEYILEAKPKPLAERVREHVPVEGREQLDRIPLPVKQQQTTQKQPYVAAQHQQQPVQDSSYQQLLVALERLVDLIRSSKGRSNRELRNIASEINNISNEMERE